MNAWSTVIAVSAAALIAVAGCGTNNPDGAPPAASGSSTSVGSDEVPSVATGDVVSASDLGERLSAAIAEADTYRGVLGKGTADEMSVEVVRSGGPAFRVSDTEAQMEIVMIGQEVYVRLPDAADIVGAPWVEVTPGGDDVLSKMIGPMMSAMSEMMGSDQFTGVAVDDEATVTAVRDGAVTYRIEADPAKVIAETARMLKDMGIPDDEVNAQSPGDVGDIGYDVTVDARGLPTKVVAHSDGEEMEVLYTDWGADITIEAPPADQVGTMPDIPGLTDSQGG